MTPSTSTRPCQGTSIKSQRPAPPTVTSSGNEYMTGLVRLKEDLLILLDVDRLFGDEESQAFTGA